MKYEIITHFYLTLYRRNKYGSLKCEPVLYNFCRLVLNCDPYSRVHTSFDIQEFIKLKRACLIKQHTGLINQCLDYIQTQTTVTSFRLLGYRLISKFPLIWFSEWILESIIKDVNYSHPTILNS
jgi:hypothetical protein